MNEIIKSSKGSLIDVTKGDPMKMGLAIVNAKVVAICDLSGSMLSKDAGKNENMPRHVVLQEVLDDLQAKYPGEMVVYGFNSANIGILPNGQLPDPDGSTPTHVALNQIYRKASTLEQQVMLLSDGMPDDAEARFEIARELEYPSNTFYIGRFSEREGRDFMCKLASISGGDSSSVSLNTPLKLTNEIEQLFLEG